MQINIVKQFRKLVSQVRSRRLIQFFVIIFALSGLALSSIEWINTPARVSGRADARDGDSLAIGGHRVRLVGIDAPELKQTCKRNGRPWQCGRAAMRHLTGLIANRTVQCTVEKRDRFRRLLAACRAGNRDLNRSMVRDGMAISFARRYTREEASARTNRRGLWAGQFRRPKLWRDQNPMR